MTDFQKIHDYQNKNNIVTSEFDLKTDWETRKRLRIEQVRLQSKEIALQLRNKIKEEQKLNLKKIEQQKQIEFKKWQRNQINVINNEYRMCLSKLGEAHVNVLNEKIDNIKKLEVNIPQKVVKIPALLVDNIKFDDKENICKEPNFNLPIYPSLRTHSPRKAKINPLKRVSKVIKSKPIKPKRGSKTLKKAEKEIKQVLKPQTTVLTKPLEEAKKSKQLHEIVENRNEPLENVKTNEITEHFTSASNQQNIKIPSSMEVSKNHFTQISDLINRRKSTLKPQTDDPLDIETTTNQTPPIRISPKKQTETYTDKVQMYDNWTKFYKEYIPQKDLVHRENVNASIPNAMQSAVKENQMELKRIQECEEKRKRAELRSEKAIERQKVIQDYERITTKLDGLVNTERRLRGDMQSQSRIRQQRPIDCENILHKQTLITCSPIKRDQDLSKNDKNCLNVASVISTTSIVSEHSSSSDSCKSIILGYNGKKYTTQPVEWSSSGRDKYNLTRLDQLLKRIEEEKKLIVAEMEKDKILGKEMGRQQQPTVSISMEPTYENKEPDTQTIGKNVQEFEVTTSKKINKTVDIPLKIVINILNDDKIKTETHKNISEKEKMSKGITLEKATQYLNSNASSLLESTTSVSTEYKTLPDQIQIHPTRPRQQQKQPELLTYITRLLEMPRTSIDNLPNVSDVSTINESIINTSSNIPTEPVIDNERMERTKKFIHENYGFVKETENSFKQTKHFNPTRDEIKKSMESSRLLKDASTSIEPKYWKSALKKKPSQKYDRINIPEFNQQSTTDQLSPKSNEYEDDLIHKYNNLTESCSHRIAVLSQLISKVRSEKQKILENNSISSSNAPNSTEYLDLPNPISIDENTNSNNISSILQTEPKEEIKKLSYRKKSKEIFNSKGMAISSDSGIYCGSRPVTSSDVYDEIETRPKSENLVLNRNITKMNRSDSLKELDKKLEENRIEISTQKIRNRPPISITRYSPNLEDPGLHELSTIIEVETTAHSKISDLVNPNNNKVDGNKNMELSSEENLNVEKFPQYDEYVKSIKENGIDKSIDPELKTEKLLTKSTDIDISLHSYVPGSDVCLDENHDSDSDSSLIDVFSELKRRNILPRPYESKNDHITIKSSSSLEIMSPSSKRCNYKNRSKEKQENRVRSTKLRSCVENNGSCTELLSFLSDNTKSQLEIDLNNMGLKWASTTLKKMHDTNAIATSSSTSSPSFNQSEKIKPTLNVGTSVQAAANTIQSQPLNLKQFLEQELIKRTSGSSSSSGMHSIFSNNLFKSINGSSNSMQDGEKAHRTSTPVTKFSSTRSNGLSLEASSNLFSGESQISSVKDINSKNDDTDN